MKAQGNKRKLGKQNPKLPICASRLLKNSFLTEKYANFPMNLSVNFQMHGFFIILLAHISAAADVPIASNTLRIASANKYQVDAFFIVRIGLTYK